MTRNATLAVLLALAARPIHAQPQPPADDSRQAEAKAYFERGVAHYKEGKYLEARAEFAAGYELSHKPLFLFNMAECSRLDGNLDLAREGYERYLREAPNGSESALAKQRLATLAGKPAEPKPAAPPPPAPKPTVEAKPATTVVPPPPAPKAADAKPVTAPPPPVVRPAAPVAQPAPPTPAMQPAPPPVVAPAPAIAATAQPAPQPAMSLTKEPDPWPTKRIAGLGVASAGVAFLATGIVYWRRSVSLGDQATAACANGCDWNAVKGTYDDSHSAAHAQWVFLGLGTAAIAAGGYLYWQSMQERQSAIAVTPRPDGAAITWSGSW
jgi:hypothetical protein